MERCESCLADTVPCGCPRRCCTCVREHSWHTCAAHGCRVYGRVGCGEGCSCPAAPRLPTLRRVVELTPASRAERMEAVIREVLSCRGVVQPWLRRQLEESLV